MGTLDHAVRALNARRLIALAGLLAGCAHAPSLTLHDDALTAQEHAYLGASYEMQGLKKEAVSQYEQAARKDPYYAEAWVALGNISFLEGKWDHAERCYRKALKARPHHPGASNNLAMVDLARDRNLGEAEGLLNDALQRGGPTPYVLDTLANLYLRQKRFGAALNAIDQADASVRSVDEPLRGRLYQTREAIKAAMPTSADAYP